MTDDEIAEVDKNDLAKIDPASASYLAGWANERAGLSLRQLDNRVDWHDWVDIDIMRMGWEDAHGG